MMDQSRYFEILQATLRMVSTVWPFHSIARFNLCAALLPCIQRLKNSLEVEFRKKNGFVPESSVAKLMNDAGW
jgi:hypothetical protein